MLLLLVFFDGVPFNAGLARLQVYEPELILSSRVNNAFLPVINRVLAVRLSIG